MSENDTVNAFKNMEKASSISERITKNRIKNARVENGVNITRMRRDWIEVVKRLMREGDYNIREEKVFPYLLSDIEKIPEDFGNVMDTIGIVKVNLKKFKKSFHEGWDDILEQISDIKREKKEKEGFDPIKKCVREKIWSVEDLSFSEKYYVQYNLLNKIHGHFDVNESDRLPYIEVFDVLVSETDNTKKVSLFLNSDEEKNVEIQTSFAIHP